MSFTFADLCHRSEEDYALLRRRTDACSRLGRSYELPCRLPASCFPQLVFLGFYRSGDRYLIYTQPQAFYRSTGAPLFRPPCFFSSFSSLTEHLRCAEQRLYDTPK